MKIMAISLNTAIPAAISANEPPKGHHSGSGNPGSDRVAEIAETFRTFQLQARPAGKVPRHFFYPDQPKEKEFLTPEEIACWKIECRWNEIQNEDCEKLSHEEREIYEMRERINAFYRPLKDVALTPLKLFPCRLFAYLNQLKVNVPTKNDEIIAIQREIFSWQLALYHYMGEAEEGLWKGAQKYLSEAVKRTKSLRLIISDDNLQKTIELLELCHHCMEKRATLFPLLLRSQAYSFKVIDTKEDSVISYSHPDYLDYYLESLSYYGTMCEFAKQRWKETFEENKTLKFIFKSKQPAVAKLQQLCLDIKNVHLSWLAEREKIILAIKDPASMNPIREYCVSIGRSPCSPRNYSEIVECSEGVQKGLTRLQVFHNTLTRAVEKKCADITAGIRALESDKALRKFISTREIQELIARIAQFFAYANDFCFRDISTISVTLGNDVFLRVGQEAKRACLLHETIVKVLGESDVSNESGFFSRLDLSYFALVKNAFANEEFSKQSEIAAARCEFWIEAADFYNTLLLISEAVKKKPELLNKLSSFPHLTSSLLGLQRTFGQLKAQQQVSEPFLKLMAALSESFKIRDSIFSDSSLVPLLSLAAPVGTSFQINDAVLMHFKELVDLNRRAVKLLLIINQSNAAHFKSLDLGKHLFSPDVFAQITRAFQEKDLLAQASNKEFLKLLESPLETHQDLIALCHKLGDYISKMSQQALELEDLINIDIQCIEENAYFSNEARACLSKIIVDYVEMNLFQCQIQQNLLISPFKRLHSIVRSSEQQKSIEGEQEAVSSSTENQLIRDDWRAFLNIPSRCHQLAANCKRLPISPDKTYDKSEFELRTKVMSESLEEIQHHHLICLQELSKTFLSEGVQFTQAEVLCQSTALLIEAALKYRLAYEDIHDPENENQHIFFSRSSDQRKKLLLSEHQLNKLAIPLQQVCSFSHEELNVLNAFSDAIVYYGQSHYFRPGPLSFALLSIRAKNHPSRKKEEPNPLWGSVGSVISSFESKQRRQIDYESNINHFEELGGKINIALSMANRLLSPRESNAAASLVPKNEEAKIYFTFRASWSSPERMAVEEKLFKLNEILSRIAAMHPRPEKLENESLYSVAQREKITSHSLLAMARACEDVQDLCKSMNFQKPFNQIKSMIAKVALVLQEALRVPLALLPIQDQQHQGHALFEQIASFGQIRPRSHSHRLDEYVDVLQSYLKGEMIPHIAFEEGEKQSLDLLKNALGVFTRYLLAKQKGGLVDLLRQIAKNSESIQALELEAESSVPLTFSMINGLKRRFGPEKNKWRHSLEQDSQKIIEKEIVPILCNGLETAHKLLQFTHQHFE